MSGPAEVRELWRARTLSGSRYDLMVDVAGGYWVRGQNMPTPRSHLVGMDRWYEIMEPAPWPPQLGWPVVFVAPDALARDDPRRVPGGGKVTSHLVALERRLELADARVCVPVCPRCARVAARWLWGELRLGSGPGATAKRGLFGGVPEPAQGAALGERRWVVPVAACETCQAAWPTVDAPPPTWSSLSRGAGASGGH